MRYDALQRKGSSCVDDYNIVLPLVWRLARISIRDFVNAEQRLWVVDRPDHAFNM